MRRKRWVWVAAGICFLGVLVLTFEPMHIGRGILHWEAFYRARPTSYWREILQADGQAGKVSDQTVATFQDVSAIPVLLECLGDPDRNVRWPAVLLLGRFTGRGLSFTDRVLPGLRKALGDEDIEVRLQAVVAIMRMGPNARAAGPDLVRLLHDPIDQVAHYADVALWEVDPILAPEASGWKRFPSREWGFSAAYPEIPQEKEAAVERWGSPVVVHSFMARHDVTQCIIGVSEYPRPLIAVLSDQQRSDSARDWIAAARAARSSARRTSSRAVSKGASTRSMCRARAECARDSSGWVRDSTRWRWPTIANS